MKTVLMILSSKFVMTPLILLAMVHWFIYFTSGTPVDGATSPSLVFGIENGDWIERWGVTALVTGLAALRAFVWDDASESSEAE